MAQHRRANSSGQDSAVHSQLEGKNNSFEDNNVNTLVWEDRWFERGVKESIYVKLEQPSWNRGGGLSHDLSPTYNAILSSLPRQLKTTIHSWAHLALATNMKAGWVKLAFVWPYL